MTSPEKRHCCLGCKCDCDIKPVLVNVDRTPGFYVSECCEADFLTYDEKDLIKNGVVKK